ncbi:MAG TPA: hypothetical protein VHO49_14235 [Anaerolineales bacterium]|nr:hypothetical protein [Anaerolineales bacterium]
MAIHLGGRDLVNVRQMEVVVNGPDGANHLILCTGTANLGTMHRDTYTFLVGPRLVRRQFVGVIISGAITAIKANHNRSSAYDVQEQFDASLIMIDAAFDDEACQVRVRAEVSSGSAVSIIAISFLVSILAELQKC